MNTQNVAITGANGFIGKHLIELISDNGFHITKVLRKDGKDLQSVIIPDIGPDTNWQAVFEKNIKIVIHLAALIDDESSTQEDYDNTNYYGTLKLAEAAASSGVVKFIFLSTIKVFGEYSNRNNPFSTYDIESPSDCYSKSKLRAEQALLRIADETGMQVIIIRPPLVYGPGCGSNFNSLIKLVDKFSLFPVAKLTHQRSIIGIKNLCDFILHCMTSKQITTNVFLPCDKTDVSIRSLIVQIADILQKKVILIPVPVSFLKIIFTILGKKYLINKLLSFLQVDCKKTFQMTKWYPKYSLREQLEDVVNYYKSCNQK